MREREDVPIALTVFRDDGSIRRYIVENGCVEAAALAATRELREGDVIAAEYGDGARAPVYRAPGARGLRLVQ